MKDEFSFINQIKPIHKKQDTLLVGVGDDAALYQGNSEYDEIACVDTMVEDVHFRRDTMQPTDIGYKALAVNISDIAAMGGIPLYYLVSIAIPPQWEEKDLIDIYAGMSLMAERYKMDLIGGDTVSTKDKLVISVTVLGRIERGKKLLRKNARPGDILFVTGLLGASAAGLSLLFQKGCKGSFTKTENALILAHQRPEPQVRAGRILAQSGARIALNDVSDGIASEANEIAEASKVQIIVEQNKLPIHTSLYAYEKGQQLDWVLFGGEDYQLIGATDKHSWTRIEATFKKADIIVTKIGEVLSGKAEVLLKQNEKLIKLEKKGYNHFR